ncbi:lysozyme inhibitor LprI family protein [Celeribacter neptunius]|uniref:Lysozyme inhibitor LprI-like N-terminal domain-containing protein n=1 Tax=Celeribacter neptunius TaxID=588602 RepID=A0A1I3KVR7_9RHOB|nr:lysozyme inhibitor LprI family protein [Celeribacter neptunius]SFI76582.1 Protein of unknown function [Celeribacter neptunius]
MRGLALLLILPVAAQADPSLECSLDLGSQVEISNCVTEIFARAERAMQLQLGFARDAAKELGDVTGRAVALPALDAAQSAWESYREAQCSFVGSTYGGGSGTGIAIQSCRVEMTRARTTALQRR